MSFRKYSRFAIPLLLCALFWKPLSLAGIGAAAKAYLYFQKGWKLSYSSMAWTQKGIAFADLSLTDKVGFTLHAAQATASLRNKHLDVERPFLTILRDPRWAGAADDWTCSLREGILEGEGIEKGRFSLEVNHLGQHLTIDWEEGGIVLDACATAEGSVLNVALNHVDLSHLRRWTGGKWSGRLQGQVHWMGQTFGGHLEGQEIQYEGLCNALQGTVDWESPLEWQAALHEGRLRAAIADGCLRLARSELQKIHGELSYLGDAGAKWDCSSALHDELVQWEGRIFPQGLQGSWVETAVHCGGSAVLLSGRGEQEVRRWEGRWSAVTPGLVQGIQDIGSLFGIQTAWSFVEGTLSGLACFIESEGEILSYEVPEFQAENLLARIGPLAFGCEQTHCQEGRYSLQGGHFSLSIPNRESLTGSDWNGEGTGFSNHSSLSGLISGNIGGFETTLSLQGSIDQFQGHAFVEGLWSGECAFAGDWGGESCHLLVSEGNIEDFHFSGRGSLDSNGCFSWTSDRFAGPLDPLLKIGHSAALLKGQIESMGRGFSLQGSLESWDWSLEARITEGRIPLFAFAHLENLGFELEANANGFSCYRAKGIFSCGRQFPFHCPILQTDGSFDVRLEGETWDCLRLAGQCREGEAVLDEKKSHLLGIPIGQGHCQIAEGSLKSLQLSASLPWKSFASFFHLPSRLDGAPIEGGASFSIAFEKGRGAVIEVLGDRLTWDAESVDLMCRFTQEKGARWSVEKSHVGDFSLEGLCVLDPAGLRFEKGKGKWREELEAEFEARFDSAQKWGVNLSHVRLNLNGISPLTARLGWPLEKIEGILEGTGVLSYEGKLESDFDCSASALKIGSLRVENRTPLHLYYSSEQGFLFRGLDLAVLKSDLELPWADCKIGLLQYDREKALWILTHSHVHLPADFFAMVAKRPPFLDALSLSQELDFVADIECSADFSTFVCSMKEGFIPYKGEMRHVQNLHLFWDPAICSANFDLFYQSQLLRFGLVVDLLPHIAGRLTIQDGIAIDWTYDDHFSVQAVEGTFAGMDISLHPEGETLIGSARIDFNALSEVIPPRIAQVFRDLKMGKGYELMGRVRIGQDGVSFKGILSGKQLELFDYQLRTLLAQVEITPSQVRIYDVKISDSAGVMKIDEILAAQEGTAPWTLSIPHLTISELRPSLIQKLGKPPGAISPLVVRQLKIDDLKGLLEDSKTYTAKGELHFINSYKREHTVFDIPSDVLSRIVGIDLDLLIPVCGTLRYELKNGFFHLTELASAFSENKRSEFFLVKTENAPTVALDGRLNILIKMKQFVLFKITEAFVISIDGKLDDPSYHLQRKRRFLGLEI